MVYAVFVCMQLELNVMLLVTQMNGKLKGKLMPGVSYKDLVSLRLLCMY